MKTSFAALSLIAVSLTFVACGKEEKKKGWVMEASERQYFELDATVENGVLIVNQDSSAGKVMESHRADQPIGKGPSLHELCNYMVDKGNYTVSPESKKITLEGQASAKNALMLFSFGTAVDFKFGKANSGEAFAGKGFGVLPTYVDIAVQGKRLVLDPVLMVQNPDLSDAEGSQKNSVTLTCKIENYQEI